MQHHPQLRNVFEVAANFETLTGSHAAALKRIFRITSAQARCNVGPELSSKYKVLQDNLQTVVSVTNLHTLEQTWYNQARTTKPQTFTASSSSTANLDPTDNGANCDFCAWSTLTATDPGFGRVQLPHAVTGSNLFKYAEPSHGVVLFRHHDPLVFSQAALSDLLDASWLWFQESHKLNPTASHPFMLWNCLPRAGASQYHGHAQVMLSSVPVPKAMQLQQAELTYQQQHPGCCYYTDLLAAHAAVGLARQIFIPATAQDGSTGAASDGDERGSRSTSGSDGGDGAGGGSGRKHSSSGWQVHQGQQQQQQRGQGQGQHAAWCFASLAPFKDMEVTVVGQHMCCPAFQRMLHAALRALIDGLGSSTFNVGLLNVDLTVPTPAGVGLARQHWRSSQTSSTGSTTKSSSGAGSDGDGNSGSSSNGSMIWLPDADLWGSSGPVIARLASRGKLTSAASDFGGLEVWGGASIGHTDPFLVVQQLDMQLAAAVVAARSSSEPQVLAVSVDN